MVYDNELAERVRFAVGERTPYEEKKMFGGLAFMVNTHMACGMVRDGLLVRVGPDGHDEAIARGAEEAQFTRQRRPMRGMVTVAADLLDDPAVLEEWVDAAVALARALPPKPPKPPSHKAVKKPR